MFQKNKKLIFADIGSYTHVGQVRSNNEDRYTDFVPTDNITGPYNVQGMITVADGMGGHLSGEIASETTVNLWQNLFLQPKIVKPISDNDFPKLIIWELQNIHKKLREISSEKDEYQNMGSTFVSAVLRDNHWYIINVGDSRAYIIRDEKIHQLSVDDNIISKMIEEGKITEEQGKSSPFKSQLSQALGAVETIEPHLAIEEAYENDVILICSDGLTEYIREDEILYSFQATSSCQEWIDTLGKKANTRGGKDNITIMAVIAGYKPRKLKKEKIFTSNTNKKFALFIGGFSLLGIIGLSLISSQLLLKTKQTQSIIPTNNPTLSKTPVFLTISPPVVNEVEISFAYSKYNKKLEISSSKWLPIEIDNKKYDQAGDEIKLVNPVEKDWSVKTLKISVNNNEIYLEFDKNKYIYLNNSNKEFKKKALSKYTLPSDTRKIKFCLRKDCEIPVVIDVADIKNVLK